MVALSFKNIVKMGNTLSINLTLSKIKEWLRFKKRDLIFTSLLLSALFFTSSYLYAEEITIAAASDLKFALNEILNNFRKENRADKVEVIYGSSGKFYTQILQGAPFDIFFSADISYPKELAKRGFAASEIIPYGVGRIALWSVRFDAGNMKISDLLNPKIKKVAIANPKHAPYGRAAEEALRSSGIWDKIQPKLIFGENISQTAQFVQSGNADIGIIALSLLRSPELSKSGGYSLITDKIHKPLEQRFIITKVGSKKDLANRFAEYMRSKKVTPIMLKYGFILPNKQ